MTGPRIVAIALLAGAAFLGGTAEASNLSRVTSCAVRDSTLGSLPRPPARAKNAGSWEPAVNVPAPTPVNPRGGRSPSAPSDSTRPPRRYPAPTESLVAALRQGGYVLVFRHGKTDWGQRDASIVDFADRAAQRNLSEAGRRESEEVGRAIAALRIPVGKVLSSPMWRCRDTATLAFGKADTTIHLFQRGREGREFRVRLLGTPPEGTSNLVLVTHQDMLLPILNLQRDELGEGEALIVKPLGSNAFEVLAQATPADWARFATPRKP